MVVNQKVSPVNCMSMHKSYYGEWNFDTIMKPIKSPLVTASWVRAIHKGQKQLQKGIKIACPVLIMTSGSSSKGMTFRKEHLESDTVLDVEDIQNFSKKIEGKTDLMIFPNGLHDLVLSRKEVRDKVYNSMFKWIKEVS
jgi:alpha-beta hydrolase superfamily lysophospholipase